MSGYNPSAIGYSYIKIQATDSTADGAVLINAAGKIQGIRMPSVWLLQKQVCAPGEVCAVDAAQVGTTAIPALRTGRIVIKEPLNSTDGPSTSPPSIPNIFKCNITIDGADAPVGTRVYAKMTRPGQPDHWESEMTTEIGFALVNVSAPSSGYHGATVEFWTNGRKAGTTGTYDDNTQGITVPLNLAF